MSRRWVRSQNVRIYVVKDLFFKERVSKLSALLTLCNIVRLRRTAVVGVALATRRYGYRHVLSPVALLAGQTPVGRQIRCNLRIPGVG
jgi:hypothetical protein